MVNAVSMIPCCVIHNMIVPEEREKELYDMYFTQDTAIVVRKGC